MRLDGLQLFKSGDALPAAVVNEIVRRVMSQLGGVNGFYSPHLGFSLRRQAGGGGLDLTCMQITGYGAGKFNKPNSSFRCKPVNADGSVPDDPNSEIEVFARTYPAFCQEDLTAGVLPCFVVGDRILVGDMDVIAGATLISGPFCIDCIYKLCQ